MREFEITGFTADNKNGQFTYECIDRESIAFNEFSQDKEFEPHKYEISYDCHNGIEAEYLKSTADVLKLKFKNLKEAAKAISEYKKPIQVFYSREFNCYYFKFWQDRVTKIQ